MSKELTKEEHYEERKRLYNQFKTDNPQTIGETDKAFDNDNFIDWLVDNQNTKPLIDEIAKLKASKSEDNEAVEFMDWVIKNEYYYNGEYWYKDFAKDKLTTIELYETFKTRNNK